MELLSALRTLPAFNRANRPNVHASAASKMVVHFAAERANLQQPIVYDLSGAVVNNSVCCFFCDVLPVSLHVFNLLVSKSLQPASGSIPGRSG